MALAIDDDRSDAAVWIGFAMMCIGMFIALLDTQVVVTSLPAIQRALHIPQERMSWIQTAYLIAEIISIPLTGLLTRALGIRWLFIAAASLFTLASIGCANSMNFRSLIVWRICQGLSGGTLVPAVFSAVFLLFPLRLQTLATMIASVLAVFAPTIGPLVGGWVTTTYAWPSLFLINVVPGIAAVIVASFSLPKTELRLDQLKGVDAVSFVLGAVALSSLEVGIKEAPDRGWTSPLVIALLLLCSIAAVAFVRRTLRAADPLVDIKTFRNRNFSIGCLLSFVLGVGLYGSVYMMLVFLTYVRGHDALAVGRIMLVTGVAQLACAPLASILVGRVDERVLSAAGFALFGLGLGLSFFQNQYTDFDGMFLAQLLRGCAIMFCILPPTQLALGGLEKRAIPDASGLFNLMRNLGGAVGIAMIDSIIFSRSPHYAHALVAGLAASKSEAFVKLEISQQTAGLWLLDPNRRAMLSSLVKKIAFVEAINDAWMTIAIVTIAALTALLLAKRAPAVLPG